MYIYVNIYCSPIVNFDILRLLIYQIVDLGYLDMLYSLTKIMNPMLSIIFVLIPNRRPKNTY